ncbi:DUF3108 domain-containing protein [Flexibacterium corallicola]|uniref:DUF3108 domain-containing protein n=1 Tax=Flexibacterium corallicola TaxID=3037259 RepID=UPI00286ECE08|nr:DUF3108 domain-containing protein [Pseudovibrio sp. M1P-2-3]
MVVSRVKALWDLCGSTCVLYTALFLSIISTDAFSKSEQVNGNYNISVAGFTVAKGTLNLTLNGSSYSAAVEMEPAGIGTLFSTGKGGARAKGWVSSSKVLASRYEMASSTTKRDFYVNLKQASGHIHRAEVRPGFKPSKTRIKVTKEHIKNALDPLSAALMPVKVQRHALSPKACERTLPIFDGWVRFDIKLEYKEVRHISNSGYEGPVVICKAKWIPVAGHKPERKNIKMLSKSNKIEVWLAPISQKRVLIPYRISIPTGTGALVVEARQLTLPTSGKRAAAQ